jgi:hypothetical protein
MVDYQNASNALNAAGIDINQDFFTLRSGQIEALLELAKIQSYRRPAYANGSKARYYFHALQRSYKKYLSNNSMN